MRAIVVIGGRRHRLVGRSDVLAGLYGKLLRGYALDAVERSTRRCLRAPNASSGGVSSSQSSTSQAAPPSAFTAPPAAHLHYAALSSDMTRIVVLVART